MEPVLNIKISLMVLRPGIGLWSLDGPTGNIDEQMGRHRMAGSKIGMTFASPRGVQRCLGSASGRIALHHVYL